MKRPPKTPAKETPQETTATPAPPKPGSDSVTLPPLPDSWRVSSTSLEPWDLLANLVRQLGYTVLWAKENNLSDAEKRNLIWAFRALCDIVESELNDVQQSFRHQPIHEQSHYQLFCQFQSHRANLINVFRKGLAGNGTYLKRLDKAVQDHKDFVTRMSVLWEWEYPGLKELVHDLATGKEAGIVPTTIPKPPKQSESKPHPPAMKIPGWKCPLLNDLGTIDTELKRRGIPGDKTKLKRLKEYLSRRHKRKDIADTLYLEESRVKTTMPYRTMFANE